STVVTCASSTARKERKSNMRSLVAKTAFLVLSFCLVPIVAAAQKVTVDYDRDVNFSKFTTYTWQLGQPAQNPLVDRRIVNAIDNHLAAKGWNKAGASSSAIVVYYAGVDARRQLNGWGSGPGWAGHGTVNVDTILTGQLVVDVYDASSKQLVWRGVATDTMSDKAEKNDKRLNDAVAKLLKKFPPRS